MNDQTAESTSSRGSETGLSLIELIVYIMLTMLLSSVVVMILVNSWRTQETVTSTSEATNQGQVISSAIERAVRNAYDFEVTGDVLRVRTSMSSERACEGYSLPDGGESYIRMTGADLSPVPDDTWGSWEGTVRAVDGETILTWTGLTVHYKFEIQTEAAPVRFEGEATARNATGVSAPCWD